MSIFSLFFIFEFINKKSHPIFSEIAIIFFTAYLSSDLIIGTKEYSEHLSMLEGYIHHSIYIIINIYSIMISYSPIYALFLIAEIPTILLSYYNLFDKPKNKQLFSNIFLFFRIFIMIILVLCTLNYPLIKYFALPIIFFHIYWYNKSLKHKKH